MVQLICDIKPKYKEYVFTTKNGKHILIGDMNKAVYGNMLSGILFYEKLATYLLSVSFESNGYDLYNYSNKVSVCVSVSHL